MIDLVVSAFFLHKCVMGSAHDPFKVRPIVIKVAVNVSNLDNLLDVEGLYGGGMWGLIITRGMISFLYLRLDREVYLLGSCSMRLESKNSISNFVLRIINKYNW